jgi:hypothetical protein
MQLAIGNQHTFLIASQHPPPDPDRHWEATSLAMETVSSFLKTFEAFGL